ncbi:hypothetical protein NP493_100g07046 [Ridgeia piscesae]|uniref:Uncharacterized protein n=1 Tax=Ridgeia piscesae TaxID=27915 RepID=A0AAD9P7V0_RIDPI|nr:hypothetical protein NP493_100g07046 [Ridgeia piscesae]
MIFCSKTSIYMFTTTGTLAVHGCSKRLLNSRDVCTKFVVLLRRQAPCHLVCCYHKLLQEVDKKGEMKHLRGALRVCGYQTWAVKRSQTTKREEKGQQ